MFQSADLEHRVDDATYDAEVPGLRTALLEAQYDLLEKAEAPVVLLVSGVDGAGKGETVNRLHTWMDPRHLRSHSLDAPTDEERERPPMWRFWRDLPPKGKIGIFFGSWYTEPIDRRAAGTLTDAELDQRLQEIVRFERLLADEGSLVFKLWLHLSRRQQKERLKRLEQDPRTRWRVTPLDWKRHKQYDALRAVAERVLRHTDTAAAPWTVVSGYDKQYRNLAVGTALLRALRGRLDGPPPAPALSPPVAPAPLDAVSVLRALDLSQKLGKARYEDELEKYQGRLNLLVRDKAFQKLALVAVFEGSDAAGKGGAIRRVTAALDARQYQVARIGAPTPEERAQPYLWRFWRQLPRRGHVVLFDRSWYGRVLVERVEGFAAEADWRRAYGEINDFEDQLVRDRVLIAKFWLAISKDEQIRRFEARQREAFKHFKITDEDWRNRERWDDYERAVCDMVDRTSSASAPWTLIEAEDKRFARVKVLKTLCELLESAAR